MRNRRPAWDQYLQRTTAVSSLEKIHIIPLLEEDTLRRLPLSVLVPVPRAVQRSPMNFNIFVMHVPFPHLVQTYSTRTLYYTVYWAHVGTTDHVSAVNSNSSDNLKASGSI